MINVSGVDKRLEDVKEIKALNLPIFVCGGGTYARVIKQYLHENGISDAIRFVVDDAYYTPCDEVLPFSEYMDGYADKSVLIFGFYNYKAILKKREAYTGKIKHMYDFHFTSLGYNRLKYDKNDVVRNLDGYQKTYDLLSDDKSRQTMELYLRAAVNGEFDELYKKCHVDVSYFNDVTDAQKIDVLIDCGAFDGDSIHDFVNVFHEYERIYAFEPDERNREKLNQRIERENIENVEVVPYGAYKEKNTLYFSNDGESSSHLDSSGIAVDVTTIDECVKDYCLGKNVLIKMDIEGAELDALIGAKNTIINNHPCLTICVYHKEHDLIDIPQYINALVGDGVYNYYLRFHGLDLAELVFYAVPVNRN